MQKYKDFLTCANKSEELGRNPCIYQKKCSTFAAGNGK